MEAAQPASPSGLAWANEGIAYVNALVPGEWEVAWTLTINDGVYSPTTFIRSTSINTSSTGSARRFVYSAFEFTSPVAVANGQTMTILWNTDSAGRLPDFPNRGGDCGWVIQRATRRTRTGSARHQVDFRNWPECVKSPSRATKPRSRPPCTPNFSITRRNDPEDTHQTDKRWGRPDILPTILDGGGDRKPGEFLAARPV